MAIRMPYIRVVDIQDDSDGDTFTSSFTCAPQLHTPGAEAATVLADCTFLSARPPGTGSSRPRLR